MTAHDAVRRNVTVRMAPRYEPLPSSLIGDEVRRDRTKEGRYPMSDYPQAPAFIQGRAFIFQDRFETVRTWRELAEQRGLTLRGLAHAVARDAGYVGTAQQVADQLDAFVQQDGADGVVLGSHLVPSGLDEFVDQVVPLLQERGSLRTDYAETTLRGNLGLPIPGEAELAEARA